MKNVKIFCKDCGKEMWEDMSIGEQECYTLADIEKIAECTDCLTVRTRKELGLKEEDELYTGMEEDVARRMKEEGYVAVDAKIVQKLKDITDGVDVDLDALLPDEDE